MEEFKNMFLTPQDLRIGNFINYENTIHIVTELHQEKVIHHWIGSSNDGYVTRYNQILSLPLTIREVENFGFMEDFERLKNVKGYFNNQGYFLEENNNGFALFRFDLTKIVDVDFVHELQNIYFDLTKRHLVYKQ